MDELKKLDRQVGERFKNISSRHFRASLFVKIVFVGGGSLAFGVAQFLAIPKGQSPSVWAAVGIIAAIVVGLGGIFIALTERDVSKELDLARRAVAEAKERDQLYSEIDAYLLELRCAVELYTAMNAMRGVVEQTLALPSWDAIATIDSLLRAAKKSLLTALRFRISEHWTLCVYVAEKKPNSDETVLRCVAHIRSEECDLKDARIWPKGVGVPGITYAKKTPVVVNDMTATEVGSIYETGGEVKALPHDRERYRSAVGIPALTEPMKSPWGVVVATSGALGHFNNAKTPGIHPSEAVRALANMIELVVRASYATGNHGAHVDAPHTEPDKGS